MRRLILLLVLLTGLTMFGLTLLKGLAGQRSRPPQTTWGAEQNEVFPSPGLEMARVEDRGKSADENRNPEGDTGSARRELGPTSRQTPEGEGPVVLVVDKATDLPVAGARVAYIDQREAGQKHREEEGPPYAHKCELAERYGAVLVTGMEGKVRLPVVQSRLLVAASHGDMYGALILRPSEAEEIRLALEPDETLVVQVVDSTGTGREGIPLGVYQGPGWSGARRLWRGESSAEGIVSLKHFQLLRREASEGNRFAAALLVPLGQPAATEFRAHPLPAEPVRVQLPLTGSLEIRLVDAEGQEVLTGGHIALKAMRSEEWTFDLPLEEKFDVLSARKAPGESSFLFPFVGLGLELEPNCFLNGDRRSWSAEPFRGPTAPDELLRARVTIPGDITLLSGVILDGMGNPRSDERIELQIDGTEGRIARSRVNLGADGRFELAARFKDKTPPFALQIQTWRPMGMPVTGLRLGLPDLVVGRRNDLGELSLDDLELIASGRVIDELGDPVTSASVYLQRFRVGNGSLGPDGAVPVQAGRWVTESMVRARTDNQGHFQLLGRAYADPIRVQARGKDHLRANSQEIALGAEVELQLTRAGSLRGEVTVPTWLPKRALRVHLVSQEDPDQNHKSLVSASEGRGRYRLTRLTAGVYDLSFEVPGFDKPILQVFSLPIVAGENGQNPQLQGLDLTPFIHRFLLRTLGSDGSQPADGTVVARHPGSSGEPASTGFKLRDGRAEFATPHPTLDVTVLARGYRPQQLTVLAGGRDLYLERSPSVVLQVPGLRDLVGANRKVRITLARNEPSGSLRVVDQASGRSSRVDNALLEGGSALLGSDDLVRISLDSEGSYDVTLRVEERGAESVPLGAVQIELDGGAPTPIAVPWDRDKVADAIGQSGQSDR